MADVGIKLTMTENASSIAPKITESLRNISQAGEEMVDALQLGDLEEKYKAFADRVDKLHDMQRANQRELVKDTQGARGATTAAAGRAPEQMVRGAGGVVTRLGETGDVAEAGGNVAQMIKGMMAAAGPAGIALGLTAGALLAANAVSKQYEKIMPETMDLTAALGELGKTTKETGDSITSTFKDVGATAADFGYSLEQGLKVTGAMAAAGMGLGAAGAAAGDVYGYGRQFGVSPEALMGARALGGRFGQQGVLGYAAGGLAASGMAPGQYREFLNATMNIFEEGLSKGIVKGWDQISTTQTWIAQLGDAFKGQYGLNLYRKMEQATMGATALQTEQDIMMFRAGRDVMEGMTKKQLKGLDPRHYQDVMQYMERGVTPELFEAWRKRARTYGGGETQLIEQIRSSFDVNYTTAKKMARMTGVEAVQELAAKDTDSWQKTLLQTQATIKLKIIDIASHVAEGKANILEGASGIIDTIKKLSTYREAEGGIAGTVGRGIEATMGGLAFRDRIKEKLAWTKWLPGKYGEENIEAGTEMSDILRQLTRKQLMQLELSGAFGTLIKRAEERTVEGEKEDKFTAHDFLSMLRELKVTLDALNINVEKIGEIEAEVEQ